MCLVKRLMAKIYIFVVVHLIKLKEIIQQLKECLGIVWAVKQHRNYLLGRPFIIRTDHKPLQWLFNIKNPCSRLLLWRLKLEVYGYTIENKKG